MRELEHAIEKAVILSERDRIGVEALPDLSGPPPAAAGGASGAAGALAGGLEAALAIAGRAGGGAIGFDFSELTLADFDARWLETEAAYLRHLVEKAGGNFSRAARLARVKNRNTLIARLKRHGIERPR